MDTTQIRIISCILFTSPCASVLFETVPHLANLIWKCCLPVKTTWAHNVNNKKQLNHLLLFLFPWANNTFPHHFITQNLVWNGTESLITLLVKTPLTRETFPVLLLSDVNKIPNCCSLGTYFIRNTTEEQLVCLFTVLPNKLTSSNKELNNWPFPISWRRCLACHLQLFI